MAETKTKTKNAKRKITMPERITLLTEPLGTWGYHEIMKYFGCSYGSANKILVKVEFEKGRTKLYEGQKKRRACIDDVLELVNKSNRIKELEVLQKRKEISALVNITKNQE